MEISEFIIYLIPNLTVQHKTKIHAARSDREGEHASRKSGSGGGTTGLEANPKS